MWEVGRSAHRRIAAWGSHLLAHQVPWLELPDLCWMLGCWMVVDGGLMWLSLLINSDDYWCVCVFCSFWECLVARLRVFGHVSRKCIGLAGFGMVWHGLTEKWCSHSALLYDTHARELLYHVPSIELTADLQHETVAGQRNRSRSRRLQMAKSHLRRRWATRSMTR